MCQLVAVIYAAIHESQIQMHQANIFKHLCITVNCLWQSRHLFLCRGGVWQHGIYGRAAAGLLEGARQSQAARKERRVMGLRCRLRLKWTSAFELH